MTSLAGSVNRCALTSLQQSQILGILPHRPRGCSDSSKHRQLLSGAKIVDKQTSPSITSALSFDRRCSRPVFSFRFRRNRPALFMPVIRHFLDLADDRSAALLQSHPVS
jgi:hypothetical protein